MINHAPPSFRSYTQIRYCYDNVVMIGMQIRTTLLYRYGKVGMIIKTRFAPDKITRFRCYDKIKEE